MSNLRSGDRIHLVSRKDRRYTVVLKAGGVFRFSGEMLAHDDLIGQPESITVRTSRGTPFVALKPTLAEYVLKMPRGAQVIYPKDLSLILMWADIYPGAKVLEAGIGSGALTMALLRSVGEKGSVISYEVREDFAKRAQENINQFLGPASNLVVRMKNIYEGIEDRPVDRLVLDLPEPWLVVPHAVPALRPGGIFLCLLPTVPQVQQVVAALRAEKSFGFIETFETLLRTWNIDGRSVRPDHRMVAHSAFLIVARRIVPDEER
ncbi:MAG: tRNA (adenine-N1)-methyltransferase [Nitrospirae bacterium]|nr:tRNA (adenine-N1)-methyltransferase [Nitrospirota bacterium]